MISNNRGLSTIVTTLILVLLVLVAVGILWNPVKNLLTDTTDSFDKTKCLTVDLKPKVENTTAPGDPAAGQQNYKVTLTRSADGNKEDVLVKVNFHNATASSSTIYTSTQTWEELQTASVTITAQPANSNKVEITPFFIDEDTGQEQLCSTFDVDIA